MTTGPYSIGSDHWPGMAKALEETGGFAQVCGKIMAANGAELHWDGSNLRQRLVEELADVEAAIAFLLGANGIGRQDWCCARHRSWNCSGGGIVSTGTGA